MFSRKFIFLCTSFIFLTSCSLLSTIFKPDLEEEKRDRFEVATGHKLMNLYEKQDKLGYVYDQGTFIKNIWGGKKTESHTGQSITLTYTRKDFDKLKLFLGDSFNVGPSLENVHHVNVDLEDIRKYELVDIQPLVEYMGKNSLQLIRKNFVVSMIKVSRFTIRAYEKVMGQFGAEYRPFPMLKVGGKTGVSVHRQDEQIGYNVFIGYKLYNGSEWWNNNFESLPKVGVVVDQPKTESTIDRVRARVRGKIAQYNSLPEDDRNSLRMYIMTRSEYEDDWTLQSKATIDTEGYFEGIVKLGTLESGNGHRYSIATFVTYFDINRDVNSKIPFLPFNKGKYVIRVTRKDVF